MKKRTRILLVVTALMAAVVVVVVGVGWFMYRSTVATIPNSWDNPTSSDVPGVVIQPLPDRTFDLPTPATSAPSPTPTPTPTPTPVPSRQRTPGGVTVLTIGTDDRSTVGNANLGGYYDAGGARSDTLLLTHLYPDGLTADVVSIPRDTVVNIPQSRACPQPGRQVRINSAFTIGGAACTAETVAALTGEPVDHVVTVDFTSAVNIVDSLGGLKVCLTAPVNDPDSGTFLPAGEQTLSGQDALSLMRARKSLGNGSDLDRTGRQRFLLTELKDQTLFKVSQDPVFAANLLPTLVGGVNTDRNLTPTALGVLVQRLVTNPPVVVTSMLPVTTNPADPNTVLYDTTAGRALFTNWHTTPLSTPALTGADAPVNPLESSGVTSSPELRGPVGGGSTPPFPFCSR